jgi:hypothetical protein
MKGGAVRPMNLQRLREVADQGQSMMAEERRWCLGELTGPLADWSPCRSFHGGVDDQVLARCLLRAWIESTRCDCEE